MRIHKDLNAAHWYRFTILEQLANVGCDIERTIQWRNSGDMENSRQAFERALELLDLTIADPKNAGGSRKELVRVREFLISYFLYDNEYSFTDEYWQQYFFDFNYAAAVAKGK